MKYVSLRNFSKTGLDAIKVIAAHN